TAIDGWPIQLADTAGLRETRDEIESAGVARGAPGCAGGGFVARVADARADERLAQGEIELRSAAPVLRVLHKIDLPHASQAALERRFDVRTSVVTGAGIATLAAGIGTGLVRTPPP